MKDTRISITRLLYFILCIAFQRDYDEIGTNEFGEVTGAKKHHPDSTLKMTFTGNFDSVYYTGGESKDSVGKVRYSSVVKFDDKRNPFEVNETRVNKNSTPKTTATYTYDK